jgi:hypothetical protein
VSCPQVQEEVAVALITGTDLDPETSRHVSTCPACAAEQASLLNVTRLMASVSAEDAGQEHAEPASELLLQRILSALADERTRARRRSLAVRTALIAAAGVVVVAGLMAVSGLLATQSPAIRASAWAPGIHATAAIVALEHGSQIDISVNGLPIDTDCVLRVYSANGQVETIADWRAEYEGTAHVSGTSAVSPDAITRVTLAEADGSVLLDIPVKA